VNKLLREHAGQKWSSDWKIVPGNCQTTGWWLEREGPETEDLCRTTYQERTCCEDMLAHLLWNLESPQGAPVCLLLWQPRQKTRKNLEEIAPVLWRWYLH
jgi:hypothetical protein